MDEDGAGPSARATEDPHDGPAYLGLGVVPFVCTVIRDEIRFSRVDAAVDEVFGIQAEDLYHTPDLLFARFPRQTLKALQADERRHAAALSPWQGVYVMRHPERGTRSLLIRARPTASGGGVLWRGLAEDVTCVTAWQRRRHAQAERLRQVLDATRDHPWELDLTATGEIVGGTVSCPLYTLDSWRQLIHPDDAGRVMPDMLNQLMRDGRCRVEFRRALPDGGWTWVVVRGRVTRRENGRPVRAMGLRTDIAAWPIHQLSVVRNEGMLQALFDHAPIGMARNALDGMFLDVNRAFQAMTGYARDDLLKLSYWDLTPTTYAASEVNQLQAIDIDQRYGPYVKEFIHASGRRIPVRLNGVLVTPDTGAPYIWSMIEDLSGQDEHAARDESAFDAITGLPSRRHFGLRLEAAIEDARRDGQPLAVLTVDLDRFAPVNAAFGHKAGDLVLQEVSHRLSALAKGSGTLARTGGDEFSIIVPGVADHDELAGLSARIVLEMARPFAVEGRDLRLGASLGIACFPADGGDAATISLRSDLALSLAKSAGGGTFRFFIPSLSRRAGHLMEIETALHRAVAQDELEIHYQPKIDLKTRRVRGFEGLMRWRMPDGHLAMPDFFIPVAETSHLIHALGDFALHRVCRDIVDLRARGLVSGRLSVNVSAHQFSDGSLPDRIRDILAASGAGAGDLEVELTESTIMADTSRAIDALRRIRSLGVAVSVDDFGTGHSSLAYLRRLPVTGVKIDRSFLEGLRPNTSEARIAEAIERLGRELALEVTAEGVETEAQESLLRTIGCDVAQGYLYARAMALPDLLTWLQDYSAQRPLQEVGRAD